MRSPKPLSSSFDLNDDGAQPWAGRDLDLLEVELACRSASAAISS